MNNTLDLRSVAGSAVHFMTRLEREAKVIRVVFNKK